MCQPSVCAETLDVRLLIGRITTGARLVLDKTSDVQALNSQDLGRMGTSFQMWLRSDMSPTLLGSFT